MFLEGGQKGTPTWTPIILFPLRGNILATPKSTKNPSGPKVSFQPFLGGREWGGGTWAARPHFCWRVLKSALRGKDKTVAYVLPVLAGKDT